jgi:hypothetical protein
LALQNRAARPESITFMKLKLQSIGDKREKIVWHRTLAKGFACAALLIGTTSAQQTTPPEIDRQIPTLLESYRALHQHPELSHHET